MNCPVVGESVSMWKQVRCGFVKKAGPSPHLFRLRIPVFILPLMKLEPTHLPFRLFCYTAAGWFNDKFYVPAIRIEQDIRQEARGYDAVNIHTRVANHLLNAYPHNRLVKHLMENCCNTYHCPAARNLSLGRWECPVPVSPGLQCKLYRLYFFSTTGRNHSFHTGQAHFSSNGRKKSSNSPFPTCKRLLFRLSVSVRAAKASHC